MLVCFLSQEVARFVYSHLRDKQSVSGHGGKRHSKCTDLREEIAKRESFVNIYIYDIIYLYYNIYVIIKLRTLMIVTNS